MIITSHVYLAEKMPSKPELHCLLAHITNKTHENKSDACFRIDQNGRLVTITLNAAYAKNGETSILLDTNSFVHKKTTKEDPWKYAEEDFVQLSVLLVYTKHVSRFTRFEKSFSTEVIWDKFGKILPEHAEDFKKYLETSLGVNISSTNDLLVAPESTLNKKLNEKIWLKGMAHLQINASISNANVFNSLAYRAIGLKKSYGVGAVHVQKYISRTDLINSGHENE